MDGSRGVAGVVGCGDGASGDSRRVLFVASETYPLIKTGGLADVCSSLPRALAELGCDVRLLLPGYGEALASAVAPRLLVDLGCVMGVPDVRIIAGRMPDSGLPVWLVDCPSLFRRRGGPYLDDAGVEWPDNQRRFALFCHAAARLATDGDALAGWQPQVVHCHDWHSGLLPLLLHGRSGAPRTVFTIHNAAFQGNAPLQHAQDLQLPASALGPDGAEFYGQLSMLKAGIRYADRVTTVSPTYARELLTPEHGCGMDGVLRTRGADFGGILNGIDTALWNPRQDPWLPCRYDATTPEGKQACKLALQAELGFAVDRDRPLAIMLSRMTRQKMADTALAELPALLASDPTLQFALHGCGDRDLEQGFIALAAAHPDRVSVRIGYDEATAHRLQAGADLLVHGSRFEPCGLVQMYAMRYGTLPLVSRVGGLADTVQDADECSDGSGFVFDGADGDALRQGLQRALQCWHDAPARWMRLRDTAMRRDFGWNRAARQYLVTFGIAAPRDHAPPVFVPGREPRVAARTRHSGAVC